MPNPLREWVYDEHFNVTDVMSWCFPLCQMYSVSQQLRVQQLALISTQTSLRASETLTRQSHSNYNEHNVFIYSRLKHFYKL